MTTTLYHAQSFVPRKQATGSSLSPRRAGAAWQTRGLRHGSDLLPAWYKPSPVITINRWYKPSIVLSW